MDGCEGYEDRLAGVLFGDAALEDDPDLARHLEGCTACRARYEAMQETLALSRRRRRVEPAEAFWEAYSARLHGLAARHERAGWRRWGDAVRARLAPPPRWVWQGAVAVLLVALGIGLGRRTAPHEPAAHASGPPAGVLPAALQQEAYDYLDRTKMVLIGLTNYDPARGDTTELDLTLRQALARRLVDDAERLKPALSAREQHRLRRLIGELEVILLQIANLEARYDAPAIEMLQEGVDRKALLFKINVEEMRRASRAPALDS